MCHVCVCAYMSVCMTACLNMRACVSVCACECACAHACTIMCYSRVGLGMMLVSDIEGMVCMYDTAYITLVHDLLNITMRA